MAPGRVDETFQTYSAVDGSLVWSDDVEPSWGDVTIANGVVFGGTQEGGNVLYAYDAATGEVLWKNRVNAPEQFGLCEDAPAVDCGTDSFCSTGTCSTKSYYHDFGFLNGPMIVDADDGAGGRRRLIVSGSKNGTLYAFHPDTGDIVWEHAVLPTPVSPGFAGFGLFNGAIGYAEGRIHAVLNRMVPGRVDETFQAYSVVDGSLLWSDDVAPSWGDVTIANGVVFGGTQEGGSDYYAYDAATGERLATFAMPDGTTVAGGAAIVDGRMYIGYGVLGPGGLRAYALK
jgi:outer membrane protein assembly factor BamB